MRLNNWIVKTLQFDKNILVLTADHRLRQFFSACRLSLLCFMAVVLFFSQKTDASSSDTQVFLAPLDGVDTSKQLFADEVQEALIGIGLTLIDARAVVSFDKKPNSMTRKNVFFRELTSYFTKENRKGLLIEISLATIGNGRVLPSLRATALPTGQMISSVTSLDVPRNASRDELRVAALSLSRRALRQLSDNSQGFDWIGSVPWKSDIHQVTLTIENFDGCQQNYILEEIETEFPGFISIELVNASQSQHARYKYKTAAKLQRLTKWLHIFFIEHNMVSGQDFTILYNNQKLRLIKEKGAKFGKVCSTL